MVLLGGQIVNPNSLVIKNHLEPFYTLMKLFVFFWAEIIGVQFMKLDKDFPL